jgi:hypothetical protein
MVMALGLMPTTFQRTLMPRSTPDQALTTGICGALDYGFAALIQDAVEAVALRISEATSPEQADPRTCLSTPTSRACGGDLVDRDRLCPQARNGGAYWCLRRCFSARRATCWADLTMMADLTALRAI